MKINLTKGKKKVTYNMPDKWDELNLGRYMRIMKVLDVKEENDIDRIVRVVNCITDIPKKDIYGLDMKSLSNLGVHLSTFLTTKPNDELKHFIEIEDNVYGFHPSLKDMSLGEFVDLETYAKNINDNLHKILSVLYRKVTERSGDKYQIEEYKPSEERADLFKKYLKVEDFNGASVFFYDLGKELMIHMAKSSVNRLKKENKKMKEDLNKKV